MQRRCAGLYIRLRSLIEAQRLRSGIVIVFIAVFGFIYHYDVMFCIGELDKERILRTLDAIGHIVCLNLIFLFGGTAQSQIDTAAVYLIRSNLFSGPARSQVSQVVVNGFACNVFVLENNSLISDESILFRRRVKGLFDSHLLPVTVLSDSIH